MTMAIPFHWPSDEETEDNYRRLNHLLADLYDVIQIILGPRPHNGRTREESPPVVGSGSGGERSAPEAAAPAPAAPTPATPAPAAPERASSGRLAVPEPAAHTCPGTTLPGKPTAPRRRRRQPKHPGPEQEGTKPCAAPATINFGFELSQVRELTATTSHQREGWRPTEEVLHKRVVMRASSLVSLLVPAHLSGHVWTTVLLLVGWKILSRQRS